MTEAPIEAIARRDGERRTRPLIVDMDGSLVQTDTTLECALALAGRPVALLRALAAWRCGRARLKQELAAAAALDPAQLPYNCQLIAYLRQEQAAGRRLVLATGADRRIAAAVAQHLALFDTVLASDGLTNLTGRAKLAAIRRMLGGRPFGYVGNSRADLAVWREAADGVCVNARPGVARAAARATTIERSFCSESGWLRPLLRAIRPQRWTANLLVFVPLATLRVIGDAAPWGGAVVAFIAFCVAGSAADLSRELLDIDAERRDCGGARGLLASGALPLEVGLIAAPLLLLAGLGLSATVGVLAPLAVFAGVSLARSRRLQRHAAVDRVLVAALYMLRLLAGGAALG
jgi:phosphoserine phosphatase